MSADICHHRASLQRLERYVALLTRGQGTVDVMAGAAIVRVPQEMLERVTVAMSIAYATVRVVSL